LKCAPLDGETDQGSRSDLIYDPDVDEVENEDLWLDVIHALVNR
jgi:hypothetical protein